MVVTVRIKKHEEKRIGDFAKSKHLNRSQAVKELLAKGFIVAQLQEYKDGTIWMGRLAENLEMPMVEALNLAARYNAHPKLPHDYLSDAREYAKGL